MQEILQNIVAFEKEINILTVALRILLAAVFGGIIGIERGRHGSHAGLRTHILVCLGGCLTSLLGIYSTYVLGYEGEPLRVAAQVVSGIGFLGAGMIIVKNDNMITGLTTAAIMWTTAIIGIALGIGFYSGALFALLICVFTAAFLTRLERKSKKSANLYMEVSDLTELENIMLRLKQLLPQSSIVQVVPAKSATGGYMGIVVITSELKDFASFKDQIKALNGVRFVISE